MVDAHLIAGINNKLKDDYFILKIQHSGKTQQEAEISTSEFGQLVKRGRLRLLKMHDDTVRNVSGGQGSQRNTCPRPEAGRGERSARDRMSTAPKPHAHPGATGAPFRFREFLGRLDLLGAAPCTGREATIVAACLIALAFAVFGRHVARGGLSFDDWTLAYDVRHSLGVNGFFGTFNHLFAGYTLSGNSAGRPIEAAYNLGLYGLLGHHAALHLSAAVVLAALVALLFYIVLRGLHLGRLHAGAMAALVLLFPASDSTVFWTTGSIAHSAVALYLLGAICGLRGLRTEGRAAIGFHGLAITFCLASILQYQIAAPFVLLSFVLYRLSGATWRRSLVPWAAEAALAVSALLYVETHLPRRVGSLSADLQHARDIAGGARRLLASLGVQDGAQPLPTVVLLAVLIVAAATALRLPAGDVVRVQLRRWLIIAGIGLGAIGAAYSVFVPGDFYYRPLARGIGNRVNAAAAIGFVVVIYSVVVLMALVAVRPFRIRRQVAAAAGIAAAATVVLAAVYVSTVQADSSAYAEAARLQRRALGILENDIERPPPRTTVYLFGVPGEVASNVFTFVRSNDLTAALRILWDDDTIDGVPATSTQIDWPGNTEANSGLDCRPTDIQPRGWLFDKFEPTPYGRALFVDVRTRSSIRVTDRASCMAALRRYPPTH